MAASASVTVAAFGMDLTLLHTPIMIAAGLGVIVIAMTPHWNAFGQITFTMTILSALSFLGYAAFVTFFSELGPLSLTFSVLLLLLEIGAFTLLVLHTFEVLDVVCRLRWKRIFEPRPTTDYFPKVSLHLPAYNEPPEMVKQTLDALARLDYPNYEVIVIDNNTIDEETWKPVEEHCRQLGFTFFHLENWPGYKSGALNYALRHTASDTEIIGVVDSDYVVEPNYLRDLVGFFRDPKIAFVQTPQDYRDFDKNDPYEMACYHAYQYFFKVSMATRNERNGIIFGGTMGLLRREVLELVGGWDEWCITEDAEISLRILGRGYESVYVDRTYGRGLMPLNFNGLKKQRFRWAFGGMQLLRMHWAKLMPWSRWADRDNRLTFGQAFDYVSGGLQWLSDPLSFAFTSLLLVGGVALAFTHSFHLQPLAHAALFVPLVFIVFGVTKFLWAFRVRTGCSLIQAYRAFVILLSMTWVVTLACVLGLTKSEGVFLRTPKHREESSLIQHLKVAEREMWISGVCLGVIVLLLISEPISGPLVFLVGLLLWQSFIYGSTSQAVFWSWRSEMAVGDSPRRYMSRTTGERIRGMVTDARGVLAITGVLGLAVLLFYLAVINSPERERIFRTNPLQQPLIATPLVRNPPESFVKAKIFLEERATLQQDIEAIMKLWTEDGVIRDANYTPDNLGDDRVWTGTHQIRLRYAEEFARREYLHLEHRKVSVLIEETRAVLVNDLDARLLSDGTLQKVFLSRGDRWELVKKGDEWKIKSLTYNRAMR